MILRTLLLLVALVGLGTPANALGNAQLRAVPYAIVNCPFGTAGLADNGCSTAQPLQAGSGALLLANARQPPSANMINLLNATPTDFSVNGPPWNQCAIDFPCGEYKPLASLTQVNSMTMTAIGCSYTTKLASLPGPLVICTPGVGATINIFDYDFTNGGTNCVALEILGDNGVVNISDDYWLNDGKCAADINQPTMLWLRNRPTAATNVSFITLDANKANFPYSFGSCARASGLTAAFPCNPSEAYIATGAWEIDHSAFIGFVARPLQYGTTTTGVGTLAKYNALVGCCSISSAAHNEYAEYVLGASGGAGQTWIGNTFITTTFHQNTGFAALPIALPGGVGGPIPIFDVEQNFYADALAGGSPSNTRPTWAGTISGQIFSTTAISGGDFGSGILTTCGAVLGANHEVTFLPVYAGLTNTVSAGPGGGGHSVGTTNSNWQMVWQGSQISAGLDNGSGSYTTAGTVMTVTVDNGLVLQVGDTVAFGGSVGTRTIQSVISSPSGTLGTYQMSGANGLTSPLTGLLATPNDPYPGGWSAPAGPLTCASQSTPGERPVSFANPFMVDQGSMGQVTAVGNYMDMWPYGNTPLGTVTIFSNASNNTVTGTISGGTSLTLTSGSFANSSIATTTVTFGGSGYTSAPTVAYGAGCSTTPVGTAVLGSGGTAGTVVSITQNTKGAGCSAIPTVTLSGGGGSGATASSNLTPGSPLNRLITTVSGVQPGTIITAQSSPTQFTISPSQANLGPVSMLITDTFCTGGLTIFGSPGNNPNVDMSLINSESVMDSYGTSVIHGNGCAP